MKNETRFKRQFQEGYKGTPTTLPEMPSCTQPSMTLSVQELMERHTRGIDTGAIQREEIYFPDDMEVPRITDMNEISEMKERLKEKEQELIQKIRDERKEANDKREKEKMEQKKDSKNDNPKEQGDPAKPQST